MQGVLNEAEFNDPARRDRWYMRAGGWESEGSASGRYDVGPHQGGIWNPLEVKLRAGQTLFRIGHSRSGRGPMPLEVSLQRPWWFEGETFAEIGVAAGLVGLDHQAMARLKLSVSELFGIFDTIICVRLRGALGAFRGFGNPVHDPPTEGSTTPPPVWAFPGRQVNQCFIPGLRRLDNGDTDLAARAFEVMGTQPVHAWQVVSERGIRNMS